MTQSVAVPRAAGRAYYDTVTAGLETLTLYVAVGAGIVTVVGIGLSLAPRRR